MDDDKNRIEQYSKKDIVQLKSIKPLWACGENVEKILNFSLHPDNETHTLYLVNTGELIEKAELLDLDMANLFTGVVASDFRLMTTLER